MANNDDKKITDKSKSSLMTSASSSVIDSFAGWDDGVEGDDQPESAGLIKGTLIKFTNEAKWVTRDGEELPAGLELISVAVKRVVQKWQDQKPVVTTVLEPHQKFPDVKKMNEETPREDWVEGPDGHPRGPWQAQHILYLLDPKTIDMYTYPTGTDGGRVAIGELRDKIMLMQRLRGQNVYPVVTLSDTFFPTRYGGRQRPHFVPKRWVRLGGEGGEVEALPPPAWAEPTNAPAQPELPLTNVSEPSLKEQMNDEIPEFDEPAASEQVASKPSPNLKTTARRELKKNPPKPGKPAGKRNILTAG
jgi:hypothetical protein